MFDVGCGLIIIGFLIFVIDIIIYFCDDSITTRIISGIVAFLSIASVVIGICFISNTRARYISKKNSVLYYKHQIEIATTDYNNAIEKLKLFEELHPEVLEK